MRVQEDVKIPGFVGASYRARTNTLSVERCINWFLEPDESGNAKGQAALYGTPGTRVFARSGVRARGRAFFSQDGRSFAIFGTKLVEIFEASTPNVLGDVADNGRPATIHSNGIELFIVAGLEGYIFNLSTNTLTRIADPDFPQGDALVGGYVDGWWVVVQDRDPLFKISKLLDGGDWNGLDVAQKVITTDNIRQMIADEREVWLFGSKYTETWATDGSASFPFGPIPGALLADGIEALFSARRIAGGLMWLASNDNGGRTVVQARSFRSAPRVSTFPIDWALTKYQSVEEATAWTCRMNGHEWYVLSPVTYDPSWVYDATTGFWFEWGYWNTETSRYEAHLGNHHNYVFGKHLVTSRRDDGLIFEVTDNEAFDDDAAIRRLRRSPYIAAGTRDFSVTRLALDVQVGVGRLPGGCVSGSTREPKMSLSVSTNAGKTWSAERIKGLGKAGDFRTIVEWNRVGSSRHGKGMVFEHVVSDPTVVAICGAYADIEVS